MHITFQRDGNVERLRRMLRAASRKNFRRIWTVCVILLVLGGVLLAIENASDSDPFVGILFVMLGLVYAFLPWIALRRQTRRLTVLFSEPATYTITDTDITVHIDSATTIQRWTGFSAVNDVAGFWICKNKAGMPAVIIPQDCMRPEDVMTLRQFLAGRSLTPAEYRIG